MHDVERSRRNYMEYVENDVNCAMTSAGERVFDAVSSLCEEILNIFSIFWLKIKKFLVFEVLQCNIQHYFPLKTST